MANSDLALEHAALWAAIDDLADQVGLSVMKLSLRCGLDQTLLSRSKRFYANGRRRWPSMETVLLVLEATGTSLVEFGILVETIQAALFRQADEIATANEPEGEAGPARRSA